MSTIKQFFSQLKESYQKSNKQLLLVAVLFICLAWSLAGPVYGVDRITLPFITSQTKDINQDEAKIFSSSDNLSFVANCLTANMSNGNGILATITSQSKETPNESIYQEEDLSTFQNSILIAKRMPTTFISQEERAEITTYTVQEGNTISSIAASFGISLNTLLWANNLKETSLIRPGDELTILPVSGVSHKVKSGDTIGAIATKYEANTEKIIAFNDLPADGAIKAGQKLIIPDGQMPLPKSAPSRVVKSYTSGPGTGKSHNFPYGQCTWYVAQKRIVTWSGHAKSWLINARAQGYQTGSAPQVGAIMVLTEGGWLGRVYGHVAYVEAVKGQWITISEMNYTCFACKSLRTLNINDGRIRGYVY